MHISYVQQRASAGCADPSFGLMFYQVRSYQQRLNVIIETRHYSVN